MTDFSLHDRTRHTTQPILSAAPGNRARNSSLNFYTPLSSPSRSGTGGELVKNASINVEPLSRRPRFEDFRGRRSNSDIFPTHMVDIDYNELQEAGLAQYHHATISASNPLPLPKRRNQPLPDRYRKGGLRRQTHKEEAQAKPYTLEAPKSAPQTRNRATLDFYPWEGSQSEDTLNESTVKSGHYDKTPISSSETSSARPLIWSSVKHKSGLQVLSSLFITSLDQRQSHSTVKSRSTFKPPPRVTLTDAKREAWLRDLADSNIPLRRLSRTIPHGIRGKALLDQCQAKAIPAWRAVWLAKCVGANEIRASKRKGTTGAFASGGETKWIRDWTANVQQFLESLIDSCGSNNWKERMTYGLNLVAHIYFDHLIDRESFIDWIVSGLQSSHEANILAWITLVKIYWNDITATRRRGRFLAIALLEQAYVLHQSIVVEANLVLWEDLRSLLQVLVVSHAECLILPFCWNKYNGMLDTFIVPSSGSVGSLLTKISLRNQRFHNESNVLGPTHVAPHESLVGILDTQSSHSDTNQLSLTCLGSIADRGSLVTTLVQWACTRFSSKISRIYCASRLLRRWARTGIGLELPFTNILEAKSACANLDMSKLYLLLAELIRSGHFSIGRYLQWLLAKGCLAKVVNYCLDVLDNIPLASLSDKVLNLRSMVMSKLPRQSNIVAEVEETKALLLPYLPFSHDSTLFEPSDFPLVVSQAFPAIDSICGSSKFEVANWVRNGILQHLNVPGPRSKEELVEGTNTEYLSPRGFYSAVLILENLGDFPTIAEVLHLMVGNNDCRLFHAVVDFVNRRFDIFYSMGIIEALFKRLLSFIVNLIPRTLNERPAILALLSLARRLPNTKRTSSRLLLELRLCEPAAGPAGCSPVSETMAEALQNGGLAFIDNVEQVFYSGTSMDRPLLSTVFNHLSKKLESLKSANSLHTLDLLNLLSRLKSYDNDYFEQLAFEWVGMLLSSSHPDTTTLILLLLSQDIITIEATASKLLSISEESTPVIGEILVEFFSFLLKGAPYSPTGPSPPGRFEADRGNFLSRSSLGATVARRVIEISSGESVPRDKACNSIESKYFIEFLQDLSEDFSGNRQSIEIVAEAISRSDAACQSIDRVLMVTCSNLLSMEGMREFLCLVNAFNIKLWQIRLLVSFSANKKYLPDDYDLQGLVFVIADEVGKCFQASPRVWGRILAVLPEDITTNLHTSVLDELLNGLGMLDLPLRSELDDRLKNLLAVIETTEKLVSVDNPNVLLENIASKLGEFQKKYAYTHDTVLANFNSSQSLLNQRISEDSSIALHLATLLKLISIHQKSMPPDSHSQVVLCRLTTVLCTTLISMRQKLPVSLTEFLFDTISLLSDYLNPESRHFCWDFLWDVHRNRDNQIKFLLGFSSTEEHEFMGIVTTDRLKSLPSQGGSDGNSAHQASSYPLRRWEMVQDATPVVGENDTSISLTLFDAKKANTSFQ